MKMREGFLVSLVVLFAAQWACGSLVLWSEDFDGYSEGDLLPQDATYSSTWTYNPAPGIKIFSDPPMDEFGVGNKGLRVYKPATSSRNDRSYAHKDLTGEIVTPSQTLVTVEVDMYHRHALGTAYANINEFKVSGPAGDIARLDINDVASKGQKLNSTTIPGAAWTPYAWRHYRFDIDFAADTVALTIDGEASPRLTVALSSDFSASDIGKLTFGAGMYYKAGRQGESYFDNVVIHEVPEPATLGLLALGALAAWRRRK